jgi:hypothetical protein
MCFFYNTLQAILYRIMRETRAELSQPSLPASLIQMNGAPDPPDKVRGRGERAMYQRCCILERRSVSGTVLYRTLSVVHSNT